MAQHRLSSSSPPRLLDRICRASRRELILLGTTAQSLKFKDWHPMHFTAALQRLARVAENSDFPFVRCLVGTALEPKRLYFYEPDQYGMLLWSLGKLGRNSADRKLYSQLLALAGDHMCTMSPQALSSALYAIAKHQERFQSRDVRQVMESALSRLENLDDFSPQSVANIVWAYGKAEHSINLIALHSVSGHIENKSAEYEGQHISNILWALATLECPEGSRMVFNTVSKSWLSVSTKRTLLSPQSMANILWAFGKTPCNWLDSASVEHAVVALGTDLLSRFPEFEPRGIANCLWGIGVWSSRDHAAAHLYSKLLSCLAPVLRGQIPEMNTTTMVALCWCYAKDDNGLLRELARSAMKRERELSAKDHPTLFWSAIAVLSREEVGLLCTWLEGTTPRSAAQVSKCLWALVDAGYFDDDLVIKLVAAIDLDTPVSPKHYASIVWAWSRLSPLAPTDCMETLFKYLHRILPACGIEDLAQLAGSFAIMGQHDLANKCLEAIPVYLLETLSEVGASQVDQARVSCAVAAGDAIPCGIVWPSPSPSHFQLQVFEALQGLHQSVKVQQEFATAVGPVDALISRSDGRRIVVEADGPSHFLRAARGADTRRLHGRAVWKGRIVSRLLNAEVVRVNIADFSKHYLTGGKEDAHRFVCDLVEKAFMCSA